MANGAWSNSCQIQAALCKAEAPAHITRKNTNNPLVNHYLSRDGHRFMLACLDAKNDWARLCASIGRPELQCDPAFQTPDLRRENAESLVKLFDQEFARHDMEEWRRRFAGHEVIWGPVPGFHEVAADEQMRVNGLFPEIEDAPGGPMPTVANPITVAGSPKVAPRMAPEVGEHSVEILRGIGYSEEKIAAMVERGVTMTPQKEMMGSEK